MMALFRSALWHMLGRAHLLAVPGRVAIVAFVIATTVTCGTVAFVVTVFTTSTITRTTMLNGLLLMKFSNLAPRFAWSPKLQLFRILSG
jgi:hypothetical protein